MEIPKIGFRKNVLALLIKVDKLIELNYTKISKGYYYNMDLFGHDEMEERI